MPTQSRTESPDLPWLPILGPSPEDGPSACDKLVAVIERDIASGGLGAGTRMPTHRALAQHLGISVATVTKAYAAAERRGLLVGHVGRGTFVAARAGYDGSGKTETLLDLESNLPPLWPIQRHIHDAVDSLHTRMPQEEILAYAPTGGWDRHRALGASWLRRYGVPATAERTLVCLGAHQAVSVALGALCSPGDVILTEAVTYFGIKEAAAALQLRLVGVAMDEQGILPEALEDASVRHGTKVVYVIPTLQNPTARVMGERRRHEIVAVARKAGLAIIEDDVCRPLLQSAPPSLCTLAPDLVYYASGVSKVMAPGLRVGYLLAPERADVQQAVRLLRGSCLTAPQLGPAIVAWLVETGRADDVLASLRRAADERLAVARRILPEGSVPMDHPTSFHIWLEFTELQAERTYSRALRMGVAPTPPDAPVVDPSSASGLRLCLGAPDTVARLEEALTIVKKAMDQTSYGTHALV